MRKAHLEEAIAPVESQRLSFPKTASQPHSATTLAQLVSPIAVNSAAKTIPGKALTSASGLLARPSKTVAPTVAQVDTTTPGTTTPGTITPGQTIPGTTTPDTTTPNQTIPGTTTPDTTTPGTTTPGTTTPGTNGVFLRLAPEECILNFLNQIKWGHVRQAPRSTQHASDVPLLDA